jgi:uncharacterized protein YceH (UPF0502 family)
MSDTLERLRQKSISETPYGDMKCSCGEDIEVGLVVTIRERGKTQKSLMTRSHRFCATCALERLEKALAP